MQLYIFFYFCFNLLLSKLSAFNFFPQHAEIFTNNNPTSYFGFSLLLQAASNTSPARLIVGAPKANSTYQFHQKLIEPGAVYSCLLNGNGQNCKQFLLHLNGNIQERTRNNITYIHKKDKGWLGASIDGSNLSGGLFVACAPRWINQRYYPQFYLQNGICYYLQDSSNIEKKSESLLPLLDLNSNSYNRTTDSVYYYALGEAGMSVHITKNNSNILIGAPGVLQWKGMIVKYYQEKFNSQTFFNKELIPNPHFIRKIEDFSYFGYAATSGKFMNTSNNIWYVGGAPRGKTLQGQVLLYEYGKNSIDFKIHMEMTGRQAGEYFGSTISVGDINADQADDIIVGAPMFSSTDKYDVGCVYVYLNNGQGTVFQTKIINGPQKSGTRFGSAVSVIGDVNKDGYADVVIGAPYFNNNQGAIFLYLGSKEELNEKYSQIILGSDISPSLRGFGSSFSRGLDIDNNAYNDIAVGAYLSGHAIILKTRPVVTIKASMKSTRKQISIDTKFIQILPCIQYTGSHLPNNLNIKITLNTDPVYKRVYINQNHGSLLEIMKQYRYEEEMCHSINITIVNSKSDFTQPILIEMIHELIENNADGTFCATCPIVDKRKSNKTILSIPYDIGCGNDEICQTNLILTANFSNNKSYLVFGLDDSIDVDVSIINTGEPAYTSKFYAVIPTNTSFGKINDICQIIKSNILLCDIGNPLNANKKIKFTFTIELSNLNINDRLQITMNVTSLGTDIDELDNVVTLEKELKSVVDISVIGISDPQQFVFMEENKQLKQDTLLLTHHYIVQNLGPSPLDDLELVFLIPQRFDVYEENIIQVFTPEAPSMICTSSNSDGFYFDKNIDIPLIEADDPKSEKIIQPERLVDVEHISATKGNTALYSKLQEHVASDQIIPPNLPLNRTLSMSCTSDNRIICMEVRCTNTFTMKRWDQVTVNFKLLANLSIIDEKRDEKDIIVLTSSVEPISRHFIVNNTYTHTVLQGSLKSENPLKWIILGLVLGIILLCLITYILYKTGFFKRENHEKLLSKKVDQPEEDLNKDNTD